MNSKDIIKYIKYIPKEKLKTDTEWFIGWFQDIISVIDKHSKEYLIDLQQFHTYLLRIEQENHLDLEEFISIFNKSFQYNGMTMIQRSYQDFFKKFGINLDRLKTTDIIFISIHKKEIMEECYLLPEQIENIILNYYYSKQEKHRKIYSQSSKISLTDFNHLIIKKLNVETLKSIILDNYIIDKEYIQDYFLTKLERLDKLYIIDIDISNIQNNREFTLLSKEFSKQSKKNKQRDLLQVLKGTYTQFLKANVPYILSKIKYLITEIQEELELVYFLVDINLKFLQNPNDPDILIILNILLGITNNSKNKNIHKLKFRQLCLLKQYVSGILQQIEKPEYSTELIFYIQYINDHINEKNCNKIFLNDDGTIGCQHQTFHFYTIYKWYGIFCKYFTTYFPNESCFIFNIQQKPLDLLYPKKSYCESCHIQYTNAEKEIKFLDSNLKGKNVKISDQYLLYQMRDEIKFYRMKFADHCDIKPFYGHFNQYQSHKKEQQKILQKIINSLKNEIEKCKECL
jgi:hypothetical protein